MLFHIVSGQAFFSGMLLILVAVGLSWWNATVHSLRRLWKWIAASGIVLIIISATPLPTWYHVVLGMFLGMWLGQKDHRNWVNTVCLFVVVCGIALELPCHLPPHVPKVPIRSLTIIGDSVAAGTGGDDSTTTWPKLLAQNNSCRIQDLSHMGETAGSALKRLQQSPINTDSVLLEIGGNDILGSTSPAKFHGDLEELLREIKQHVDEIYMFELPLPPFYDQYGTSQRALARKYGATLIPKRHFASVILNKEMTSDGIHLTQAGHTQMATTIRHIMHIDD